MRYIIEGLEGKIEMVDCVNSSSACSRISNCSTRYLWGGLSRHIGQFLESITLAELIEMDRDKKNKNIYYEI